MSYQRLQRARFFGQAQWKCEIDSPNTGSEPDVREQKGPPGVCTSQAWMAPKSQSSNPDLLDFVEVDLVGGAVVELGCFRGLVVGDLLGMLDGAAAFEVGVMPEARKVWQQMSSDK